MIFNDHADLCEKVTAEILEISDQKIALLGHFGMVLSGGETPRGIYECMASPFYRNKFKWKKIHLFWGDERWVPPDDPRSNFRMVYDTLLTKIRIPFANVHPVPTQDLDLRAAARSYEENIRHFFKLNRGMPRFDLVLLGVGTDGHTASIFPGNRACLVKDRWVLPVTDKRVPEPRISLSLPVINHADRVFFVASGLSKAAIVHALLEKRSRKSLPAARVNPSHGKLEWFLDKAAASRLSGIPRCIGMAADHGGYELKQYLARVLREAGYEVKDFGARKLKLDDDYPDFVIPLAKAVASQKVDRGVAICGSGVGACIAANKVPGVRACMIHEPFSARQGVEDDDMNVICLGAKVLEPAPARELVKIFLSASFSKAPRHCRRLAKVAVLEKLTKD